MPCDREALCALIDGELGEPEASRVRQHLETCPACKNMACELGRLSACLAEDTVPPPGEELIRSIVEAIPEPRAWRIPSLWSRFWHVRLDLPVPALAGALALAWALAFWWPGSPSVPCHQVMERARPGHIVAARCPSRSPLVLLEYDVQLLPLDRAGSPDANYPSVRWVSGDPYAWDSRATVVVPPPPRPLRRRPMRGRWVVYEETVETPVRLAGQARVY